MSAPLDIVKELQARGVELRVEGERLRFRPADRVTPDLLARLREQKPALLAFLRPDPRDDPDVKAGRGRAHQLGVLGKSVRDFDPGPQWIIGEVLDQLSELLQGLVCPRTGWTPGGWTIYLRHRAALCDEQHRDRAILYGQAASLMESHKNDGH